MIDSSHTETLYDVIQQFREYITQNYGADSKTAQAYIRIADDFQRHVSDIDLSNNIIMNLAYVGSCGTMISVQMLIITTENTGRQITMPIERRLCQKSQNFITNTMV